MIDSNSKNNKDWAEINEKNTELMKRPSTEELLTKISDSDTQLSPRDEWPESGTELWN